MFVGRFDQNPLNPNRYDLVEGQIPCNPSGKEIIRIVVRINNIDAWKVLKDVTFGDQPPFESPYIKHEWYATAQITREKVVSICSLPFVVSVYLPQTPGFFIPAPSFTQSPATINQPCVDLSYYKKPEKIDSSPELKAAEYSFRMGFCHYFGYDTKLDEREAARCFEAAANLGHSEAQYCLGLCYLYGHGVSANRSLAYKWIVKAAANYSRAELVKRQLEQHNDHKDPWVEYLRGKN